jgi:NAD(P)-dependent dehydrogenase (short-subunit alcohol dehydrogenase family)
MQDEHVLITGGTGGLGTEVTAAFVERGAHVVVPVHAPQELERFEARLGDGIARVRCVKADVSDEAAVQTFIADMPRLHAAVHLVGGFAMAPTEGFSVDDFRGQLELNVVTAFIVIKHALAAMRPHDYGRIVTVGSKSAVEPVAQQAAYAAAKAAVLALTRSVAEETRETGITANTVLPSIIDTPANRTAMGSEQAERWVKPSELAHTIAFLASDRAGHIRGAAVPTYGAV